MLQEQRNPDISVAKHSKPCSCCGQWLWPVLHTVTPEPRLLPYEDTTLSRKTRKGKRGLCCVRCSMVSPGKKSVSWSHLDTRGTRKCNLAVYQGGKWKCGEHIAVSCRSMRLMFLVTFPKADPSLFWGFCFLTSRDLKNHIFMCSTCSVGKVLRTGLLRIV